MKKIFLLSLVSAFIFASCNKENKDNPDGEDPTSEYVLLKKDTTANDFVVELFSKTETIDMGYTPLYVKVRNFNGEEVENATVTFMPMMDMGSMEHSSPVVQPEFNTHSKLYEGAVVFTMSSDNGNWELNIMANGEGIVVPVTVLNNPTQTKYVGSYTGTDDEKYIVSIVKPFKWTVGMNDVSFMIHKKESMMAFPPVSDFTIAMEPEMTSMEHGSPNNISPTSMGDGLYSGKVNLTMTGDWRLHLDLIKEGDTIVNANIDILF